MTLKVLYIIIIGLFFGAVIVDMAYDTFDEKTSRKHKIMGSCFMGIALCICIILIRMVILS